MTHRPRLTWAVRDWTITVAPVLAIAALQSLFMPWILATTLGLDPAVEPRTVAGFRRLLPAMHAPAVLALTGYWLLAWLCVRRWARVPAADRLLAAAGALYLVFWLLGSTLSAYRAALMLCRPLGIAEMSTVPLYGFDTPSPCELFRQDVVFWLFAVLPTALLVMSLLVRIVGSRRIRTDETRTDLA